MIHEAGKKMHELFLTTGTRNGIGLNFCVYQEKVLFLESTPLLEWERFQRWWLETQDLTLL